MVVPLGDPGVCWWPCAAGTCWGAVRRGWALGLGTDTGIRTGTWRRPGRWQCGQALAGGADIGAGHWHWGWAPGPGPELPLSAAQRCATPACPRGGRRAASAHAQLPGVATTNPGRRCARRARVAPPSAAILKSEPQAGRRRGRSILGGGGGRRSGGACGAGGQPGVRGSPGEGGQ